MCVFCVIIGSFGNKAQFLWLTGGYTEDTVKTLTKPRIIDLFPKIQEHTISTIFKLTNGIRNLNANFNRPELDFEFCQ